MVALMLDFAIRHYTNNKRSLGDVMRKLYNKFYKEKKRGFTEAELKKVCEETAGVKLDEIFSYAYTPTDLNIQNNLIMAGLILMIRTIHSTYNLYQTAMHYKRQY